MLDCEAWLCGRGAKNDNVIRSLGGSDESVLLQQFNKKLCCLGQFCKQAGVPDEEISGLQEPFQIAKKYQPTDLVCLGFTNSELSFEAMYINDNQSTSVTKKIKLLRSLLKDFGFKLKVKNYRKALKRAKSEFKNKGYPYPKEQI